MSGRDGTKRVEEGKRPGPVAMVLLVLIRIYQLTLSAFIGRSCRHLPTCSSYAMDAIRMHGAWAGFWLGFWRVLRCHPFGTHGFDPVPEKDVPRFDPMFWRYRRFGVCPGRYGAEKNPSGNGDAGGEE